MNIGVLEGDSPTGPWRDPIGKPLIDRDTPDPVTVKPVELTINQLFAVTENAGTYANLLSRKTN